MNEVKLFEGQEIKVITDEGKVLVNLSATSKACGITREKNGKNIVLWFRVKEKLNGLYSGTQNIAPQYIEEINYLLNEIEETDDRSGIYMSTWMAKRLCMECNNDKAMAYKNFLATLDDNREKSLSQPNAQFDAVQAVTNAVNNIIPTIIQQFTPLIQEANQKVEESRQLIESQHEKNINDTNNIKELIGLRSSNVKHLTDRLKTILSKHYGENINATDNRYKVAKTNILNRFNTSKWEDVAIEKYTNVCKLIDNVVEEFKNILPPRGAEKKMNKDNVIKFEPKKKTLTNGKKTKPEIAEKDGKKFLKCNCCGEYKEMSKENFYADKHASTGFKLQCKACKKQYYINNRLTRLNYSNERSHTILGSKPRSATSYNRPKDYEIPYLIKELRGKIS